MAVFAHCSVAIWVYGDATLTGTTHLVWDSEATSYMAQLRRVLGDQLSVVMEIVVEKAMTPAAMGNALILAFLCFMWPDGDEMIYIYIYTYIYMCTSMNR